MWILPQSWLVGCGAPTGVCKSGRFLSSSTGKAAEERGQRDGPHGRSQGRPQANPSRVGETGPLQPRLSGQGEKCLPRWWRGRGLHGVLAAGGALSSALRGGLPSSTSPSRKLSEGESRAQGRTAGHRQDPGGWAARRPQAPRARPQGLTGRTFPPRREPRGSVHLRHHRGRRGARGHRGLQPGQPEQLRVRPREAGLLQPGRGLEVGRLLRRRALRHRLLPALRGRARDQEERAAPHEPAQQRGGQEGRERGRGGAGPGAGRARAGRGQGRGRGQAGPWLARVPPP